MMKIGIRADGGATIGMGHIMRTLVLAKELSKTEEVFYICKSENSISGKYKSGIKKVREEGFEVKLIDENNIFEGLSNICADILITDSYEVNEEYFNNTKNIFNKTGYIDDNNLLSYYNVDFLINQNLGAEEYKYNVNEYTELLLGTKYVLLREEFRELVKNRDVETTVKDILVTIGGADPNYITESIVKMIKDLDFNFHIIVGPSFKDIKTLEEMESENVKLHFNANMSKLMSNSDLAISACGSTLYELAACEVPTIGIIAAENQEKLASTMHKKGMIYNLGWFSKLEKKKVREVLTMICNNYNYRCEMVQNQNPIDKYGVFNLCLVLKEKYINKY